MGYQRFEIKQVAATLATTATVRPTEPSSVAPVATVAGWCCENDAAQTISAPSAYVHALTDIFVAPQPDDVAPARWNQFAADAQSFVARWGVEAFDLGFTPKEMLAPPDGTGRAGFVWHLRGRPVINIDGGVFYIGRPVGKELLYDA